MSSKYTTTIRMDRDLADRLDVLASVTAMSKNAVIVAAIKMLLLDYEDDSNYKELRSSWAEQAGEQDEHPDDRDHQRP